MRTVLRSRAALASLSLLSVVACAGRDAAPKVPSAPPVAGSVAPTSAKVAAEGAPPSSPSIPYPVTKVVDASDTYFGVNYKDPYRWLEDLKSQETQDWFKAQANLTDGLLDAIPAKDALVEQWLNLDKLKPATYSEQSLHGGRMFYRKRLGGENVGRLFYREGWEGAEHLLFDPATYKPKFATARATATLESFTPSWDGKHVVLSISSGGAEYSELRVLDVASGEILPEILYPSYGAYGWSADGKGFFYDAGKTTDIKNIEIELHRKAKFHELRTDVAKDRELLSDETNPELGIAAKEMPSVYLSESWPGYLIGSIDTVQNEQRIFIAPASDLYRRKIRWQPVAQRSDNLVRGMVFRGDQVYAVTHEGAPHYKLVRTNAFHPDWAHAETLVAESADSIRYIDESKDYLFIVYSNGVVGRVAKYDLRSKTLSEVHAPLAGVVRSGCPDAHSNRCLMSIRSWTQPPRVFDYDAGTETTTKSVFNTDVTYPGFDRLVSEEVEVPGHDGTPVPLSIVHEKGIPLDGSHSCILDGYGAYGINNGPYFDPTDDSLALHGVVMAYAHVRGGSEKGEGWYKAGYKATKPNTWKDFVSAGEYLVKAGYTSPGKLAGTGTSAGGILISRAVTERPDLFAAAVVNVGVANAMRAEFSPNGPVNVPEFGTVTDPKEVGPLFEMDGVQHVKEGVRYPAILGVAGWNDPRVAPWEPGKFVAAAQAASTSGKPVLLKVNYDDGHFTEETSVTFRNFAAQAAFMLWQTGHAEFQPAK